MRRAAQRRRGATLLRFVPFRLPIVTPDGVITAAQGLLGNDEIPGGSNCNAITRRFGMGCVAWCDETVHTAWFNAGFNDGRGNFLMPGVATDYALGDAYVPSTMRHYQAAGRFGSNPVMGAAGCHFWGGGEGNSHIVIFCRDNGDGTVLNIEGNHNNRCEYVRRPKNDSTRRGYCLPVYSLAPTPTPTPVRTLEDDDMAQIRIPAPTAASPKDSKGQPYEFAPVLLTPGTKGWVTVVSDEFPAEGANHRTAIGSGRPDRQWKGPIYENQWAANFPWSAPYDTHAGHEQASTVNYGPNALTLAFVPDP